MSGSFAVLETAYDGKRGIAGQSGDNGKLFDKTGTDPALAGRSVCRGISGHPGLR